MNFKIFIIILLLLNFNLVMALEGSLLTPSTTIRGNETDIVNDYIRIVNPNSFIVNVSIYPPKNLTTSLKNMTFEMQPQENRRINYTITLTNITTQRISIVFSTNDSSVGLQKKIILIVKPKKVNILGYIFYIIIIFIIVTIILTIMLRIMKGGIKK